MTSLCKKAKRYGFLESSNQQAAMMADEEVEAGENDDHETSVV